MYNSQESELHIPHVVSSVSHAEWETAKTRKGEDKYHIM